jgi:K(+)-stimulated pyrophosphate-energized sodium pump
MVLLIWLLVMASAVIALGWALHFYRQIMEADEGTAEMRKIAESVRLGAGAYLKQQNFVCSIFFVSVAIMMGVVAWATDFVTPWLPLAFVTGSGMSALCGWIGMATATQASSRTASAARESLNRALQLAFRSGAVMGLTVVGMGLLFIGVWFALLYWIVPAIQGVTVNLNQLTVTLLTFGMGISAQALFARVGGGIFTKAADVGADLVGKVEQDLKEDSPRNPATIADNVGDNVGDVAGMGADLFESYCGSLLAALALGVAAYPILSAADSSAGDASGAMAAMMLPLAIAAIGALVSIGCVYVVHTNDDLSNSSLLKALDKGINLAGVIVGVLSMALVYLLLPASPESTYLGFLPGVGLSVWVGLGAGWAIGCLTQRATSADYPTTQQLAKQAETGPATLIIGGVASGMMSCSSSVLTICLAMFLSFGFANGFDFEDPSKFLLGLYGVSIAAVGMLSTLGITLATDAYGPIADNAGGNAEMAGLEPFVRERTDALDSLGNTTAATGKGFAIGSASLTALALLGAYIESVRESYVSLGPSMAAMQIESPGTYPKLSFIENKQGVAEPYLRIPIGLAQGQTEPGQQLISVRDATLHDFVKFYDATLINPRLLIGLMIGAMSAFVFCAMTMKSVARAADQMVAEVRRQFKAHPGILDGSETPDYETPIAISTRAAQREMILPSMLGILLPIAVGHVFGVAGVLGLLAGAISSGTCLAVFMANAGGAWDNAKKFIEAGNHGGKGSNAHKAAVIGDTVGDPFKDTSGPSLNILIKLMSMVSVVVARWII